MKRRTLVKSASFMALGLFMSKARASDALIRERVHLSIADAPGGPQRPASVSVERFSALRELGFTTLRAQLGRVRLESGQPTRENTAALAYLKRAVEAGFTLKLPIGGESLLDVAFFESHPDALVRNGEGETVRGYLSPWYPGRVQANLAAMRTTLELLRTSGLLSKISHFIIDLGPASEPIFPASWELQGKKDTSYWFHDRYAQFDFSRRMQQKFGDDLSRANQRWGTSFYSWNNVAPPNQGQNAGAMWSDALLWYRDTKRHMITEQIAQAKTLISQYSMMHRPDTILLVPGKHLPGDAIDAAAKRAGVDNEEAIVMPDTDFMIDMASVFNCELQYTASQNDQEVKYLVSAVRSKDIRTHIWGENAGGHPSLNPAHLVEVSIKNRLFGFEYINAEPLFDGQTSSKTGFFSVFAKSIRHLRMAFSNGTTSE